MSLSGHRRSFHDFQASKCVGGFFRNFSCSARISRKSSTVLTPIVRGCQKTDHKDRHGRPFCDSELCQSWFRDDHFWNGQPRSFRGHSSKLLRLQDLKQVLNKTLSSTYIVQGHGSRAFIVDCGEAVLDIPERVTWLAYAMTIWTILIEGTISWAFLFSGKLARRWRDVVLMFFMLSTYLNVPIMGFATIFTAIRVAQTRSNPMRIAYLVTHGILFVWFVIRMGIWSGLWLWDRRSRFGSKRSMYFVYCFELKRDSNRNSRQSSQFELIGFWWFAKKTGKSTVLSGFYSISIFWQDICEVIKWAI